MTLKVLADYLHHAVGAMPGTRELGDVDRTSGFTFARATQRHGEEIERGHVLVLPEVSVLGGRPVVHLVVDEEGACYGVFLTPELAREHCGQLNLYEDGRFSIEVEPLRNEVDR